MQKAVIFERTRAMLREVFYSQTVFFSTQMRVCVLVLVLDVVEEVGEE